MCTNLPSVVRISRLEGVNYSHKARLKWREGVIKTGEHWLVPKRPFYLLLGYVGGGTALYALAALASLMMPWHTMLYFYVGPWGVVYLAVMGLWMCLWVVKTLHFPQMSKVWRIADRLLTIVSVCVVTGWVLTGSEFPHKELNSYVGDDKPIWAWVPATWVFLVGVAMGVHVSIALIWRRVKKWW